MNWLILVGVILGVGLLVFIVSLLANDDVDDAGDKAMVAIAGVFVFIMQLVASAVIVWMLWLFGKWLIS